MGSCYPPLAIALFILFVIASVAMEPQELEFLNYALEKFDSVILPRSRRRPSYQATAFLINELHDRWSKMGTSHFSRPCVVYVIYTVLATADPSEIDDDLLAFFDRKGHSMDEAIIKFSRLLLLGYTTDTVRFCMLEYYKVARHEWLMSPGQRRRTSLSELQLIRHLNNLCRSQVDQEVPFAFLSPVNANKISSAADPWLTAVFPSTADDFRRLRCIFFYWLLFPTKTLDEDVSSCSPCLQCQQLVLQDLVRYFSNFRALFILYFDLLHYRIMILISSLDFDACNIRNLSAEFYGSFLLNFFESLKALRKFYFPSESSMRHILGSLDPDGAPVSGALWLSMLMYHSVVASFSHSRARRQHSNALRGKHPKFRVPLRSTTLSSPHCKVIDPCTFFKDDPPSEARLKIASKSCWFFFGRAFGLTILLVIFCRFCFRGYAP